MVAAGLFSKNGDNLEKQESSAFREKVEVLRHEVNGEYAQKQAVVNNKKMVANRLAKRKHRIEEIIERNRKMKIVDSEKIIMNPMVVNLKDGTRRVEVRRGSGEELCKMDLGRSSKSRHKTSVGTQILKDH